MVGGVAASAAVRTWPFRVYSFPTDIKLASASEFPAWMYKWDNYLTPGLIIPLDDDGRKVAKQFADVQNATFNRAIPVNAERLFADTDLSNVEWN